MTESPEKIEKPFGLWKSPISAAAVSQGRRFNDVQWDSDGKTLIWIESRSGKGVLVAKTQGEAVRDLTDEANVRGGVGYGGGEFTIANGIIIFAERDGRLYRKSIGQDLPLGITPPFGFAASPKISPDGKWVCYVHSDGENDVLALVDINGYQWPSKLVSGADFYMQPTWHHSGKLLAWIEWDHPNMPWDESYLKLGNFDNTTGTIKNAVTISGDKDHPVSQPLFSPDGRWLSYIDCGNEWDDLVLVDMETKGKKVLVKGDSFSLTPNAWVQGMHSYDWSLDSQSIYYLKQIATVSTVIDKIDLVTGNLLTLNTDDYTSISQITVSPVDNRIAFIGSSAQIPARILSFEKGSIRIEARSSTENIPRSHLPILKPLTWKSSDGEDVHGIYFPPTNEKYFCSGKPPVIMDIHGGPTSHVDGSFNAEIGYFCSRGYGWLAVNYRGSSGYGRSYQNKLRLRWGELDVEDAVSAAQALVDMELADENKIVISGGSAGGYTVLNALIRYPGRFKAGICCYGVNNLFTINIDSHKFEQHYNDSLVGGLPKAAERFHAWSPVFHIDKIKDAIAIFQGVEDKVVPPAQAEQIVVALKNSKVPYIYQLYEGEGHGFRKSETLVDYLEKVERFLLDHVLFAV